MEDVASGTGGVHPRFKGVSGATPTVRSVNSSELFVPHASSATDPAGAAAVDAVVSRRRAELARLSLGARSARSRCEKVEAHVRAVENDRPAERGPSDLLAVVDTMLTKAMAAAGSAIEQARGEAAIHVEHALEEAAGHLRTHGIDPARVPLRRGGATREREVIAPPTAGELWRDVQGPAAVVPAAPAPGARAEATIPSPPPPPPAPPALSSPASAAATHVTVGVAPGLVAPGMTPVGWTDPWAEPATAPVAHPALLVEEATADPPMEGQVFELFWEQMPTDRRVRTRLRRRTTREGA
jgi:hypothetical protein